MAIRETFTTAGPISVCYPRLNGTLPLENRDVLHTRPALDLERRDQRHARLFVARAFAGRSSIRGRDESSHQEESDRSSGH